MAGSITALDREFVETWEHISAQQWGIIRLNPRGDEVDEIISGRRKFKVTTEERILFEDKVRDPKNDPFLNGAFRPVIVPESVTIESNPNALSDEEITRILESSELAWQENLKTIDSVSTYRRMLEVAEDFEGITHKRYRQLEERLETVRGELRLEASDPALQNFLADRPAANPGSLINNGSANPRRQGGRSSDYRS